MERQLNFDRVKLSFPDAAEPMTHWLSQELQRWILKRSGQEVKVEVVMGDCARGEPVSANNFIER